jgi:hypothetical protein
MANVLIHEIELCPGLPTLHETVNGAHLISPFHQAAKSKAHKGKEHMIAKIAPPIALPSSRSSRLLSQVMLYSQSS